MKQYASERDNPEEKEKRAQRLARLSAKSSEKKDYKALTPDILASYHDIRDISMILGDVVSKQEQEDKSEHITQQKTNRT